MAKVSIATGYEPVEIELWGSEFETQPETRSVQKTQQEIYERMEDEDDADKLIGMLGELLDTRLTPSDGKRTKASKLVLSKWEADELTLPQLQSFVERMRAADRPS